MKTKMLCPKCQSSEIYTDAVLSKSGDRCTIPVSSWTKLFIDVYACLNCGYIEEYLTIKDAAAVEKLKNTWKPLNK